MLNYHLSWIWVTWGQAIRKWFLSHIFSEPGSGFLFTLESYTFIPCLKTRLLSMRKKPTANLVLISWASSEDPGEPAHMNSITSLHYTMWNVYTYCICPYPFFKSMCETVPNFGDYPNSKISTKTEWMCIFVWKWRLLWAMSHFVRNWNLSCVSSVGSNEPAHLNSLARGFAAKTQYTHCKCT